MRAMQCASCAFAFALRTAAAAAKNSNSKLQMFAAFGVVLLLQIASAAAAAVATRNSDNRLPPACAAAQTLYKKLRRQKLPCQLEYRNFFSHLTLSPLNEECVASRQAAHTHTHNGLAKPARQYVAHRPHDRFSPLAMCPQRERHCVGRRAARAVSARANRQPVRREQHLARLQPPTPLLLVSACR